MLGARVALIERGTVGGTCVTTDVEMLSCCAA